MKNFGEGLRKSRYPYRLKGRKELDRAYIEERK
jgi:hypothetical protein